MNNKISKINIEVEGVAPLVTNNFGQRIRDQIRLTTITCGGPRRRRSPERLFNEAKYLLPDGSYGFPAAGFKGAMVSAGRFFDDMTMTELREGIRIYGEGPDRLVRLTCSEPTMREDIVRIDIGLEDLRYRPQFDKWSAKVTVGYDSSIVTEDQVIALMDAAGSCGIGEYRPTAPKSNGDYGRFKVVNHWVLSDVEADEFDAQYEEDEIKRQEWRDKNEAQKAGVA
jgi:hypothetical protein